MQTTKILSFLKLIRVLLVFLPLPTYAQMTNYINLFDYKNINTQTLVPVQGLNDTQRHIFTLLKHSFEVQQIINYPKDTAFYWKGLKGNKSFYSKDSLLLFFIRPDDTIRRPCILLTHGNNAKYRSSWHEQMNFYAIDLAMRGFAVAYYYYSIIFEYINKNTYDNTRNAFYNGFQSAVAASIYITKHASSLNIDTSKLFSGGHSFGAFCTLTLAFADSGQNFTDSIFSTQGNFEAKALYPTIPFSKNIKRTYVIGGGLPKDDTLETNNSRMGAFIDEKDNGLSVLFLHGRKDNLVLFDVTKFGTSDTVASYFYAEGPRALLNNIQASGLDISTKLFVNCSGYHPFINTVCSESNSNCIQQYQWPYLNEPPDSLTSTSPYFTNNLNDSLLRYFAYMATQIDDVNYIAADFLQSAILNSTSEFDDKIYFVQPADTFTFANPGGHYIFRNTDCEGNAIVVTSIPENYASKSNVQVYPNPSANFIVFESTELIQNIRVYAVTGVLLKEINANNFLQQMDVSNYSNGEYIVIIQLKNEIITKKISVIR